ncbi:MAG: hypothetical protein P8N02_00505 [Actinomycetota bacterium]|jgi:hypothetical protein|nr:hypothetical protein [Actinomycetota bacterium]
MASIRTEVTELATALGMLGYDSSRRALLHRPQEFVDVDDEVWERFAAAADRPEYRIDFAGAYRNGEVFAAASDGLRHRRPNLVEWKGGHRIPGQDQLPVDLRVDHVFLVSCKYASRILLNAAPASLFGVEGEVGDWFSHTALSAHQALYAEVRHELGIAELPPFVGDLAKHHRRELKVALANNDWGGACAAAYVELTAEVSRASAAVWRTSVSTKRQRETQLWRLLRIGPAPYYVLGSSKDRNLRLRVTTPWDWRRRFEFRDLEVWGEEAGQPRVAWLATVRDNELGADQAVAGHVEIRWSHGRFAQPPEAKVYLDTPHSEVPGYLPLV